MTKEELYKYRKIADEIELIKHQIDTVKPEFGVDCVTGSDSGFPYTKHSFKVAGYGYDECERKIQRIENRLKRKLKELVEEKDKLTEYIYGLEDSELRQILTHRYITGLTWKEIGEKMNYGTSTIRMKHDCFIKKISTF